MMRLWPFRTARPEAAGTTGPAPVARTVGTFTAGGAIPFAVGLILLPALGAWDLYRGATMLFPAVVLVVACAAGGVLAGGPLGGLRWRAAWGVAFGATFWIPVLVLSSVPALSGGERVVNLVTGIVPPFCVSLALLGAIGLALGGSGWRHATKGAVVFGAAGGTGGVLLALLVRLSAGGGGALGFAVGVIGGAAACLLPLTFAGWWLGRGSGRIDQGS